MVAIGRGLMSHPKLLLIDEPLQGLAPKMVKEVMRVIAELKERGLTVLVVEQNVRAFLAIADRGYVMEEGYIVLSVPSAELASDSRVASAHLGRRRL